VGIDLLGTLLKNILRTAGFVYRSSGRVLLLFVSVGYLLP
jgi:hypothetical protein